MGALRRVPALHPANYYAAVGPGANQVIDSLHIQLYNALSTHQCPGVVYGQWPAFKVGAKFEERLCVQCEARQAFEIRKAAIDAERGILPDLRKAAHESVVKEQK